MAHQLRPIKTKTHQNPKNWHLLNEWCSSNRICFWHIIFVTNQQSILTIIWVGKWRFLRFFWLKVVFVLVFCRFSCWVHHVLQCFVCNDVTTQHTMYTQNIFMLQSHKSWEKRIISNLGGVTASVGLSTVRLLVQLVTTWMCDSLWTDESSRYITRACYLKIRGEWKIDRAT